MIIADCPCVARYRLELVREANVSYETSSLLRTEEMVVVLRRICGRSQQEVVGTLFLDVHHHVTGYIVSYKGTLSRMAAEPRGLLLPAFLANASGVVHFHNHPSGDPIPSREDMSFTKGTAEASRYLGLFLADHIILGEGNRYQSMRNLPDWSGVPRAGVHLQ